MFIVDNFNLLKKRLVSMNQIEKELQIQDMMQEALFTEFEKSNPDIHVFEVLERAGIITIADESEL